ncbi:C39 family peptidase [Tenggerimyces flavus]|uniref:C39 family peptidase n=1 Tax=Tenggerimyces flavus TaxID=1708749 RepID=A0ABV7Y8U3_9ACTN|nr:C39 family peptidase [Tenggerimyces flavus]MBM7783742.1 hypothetical protein [Tenggerimyces flavus]
MTETTGFDTELDPAAQAPESATIAGEPLTDGGVTETFDNSGNGVPDLVLERLTDGSLVAVSDENGDRLADTMGVDLDGNGVFELMVTRTADGYHVSVDQGADGVFESELDLNREEMQQIDPGVVEALDLQFGDSAQTATDPVPESPFVVDGQLVGDPVGDSEHWFEQAANGFCVPASIAQIVSEYTGEHNGDEQQFVERANELKVFEVGPNGVPGIGVDGALALLEDAGVPASIEFGTGVETLVEYLDEGRSVMLAVDSGEIWTGETTEDNAPDHAIVVTGVDVERGVVVVSDPGDPEGDGKEYPIDVLVGAWADSGYAAVVCDVTPEEFAATAAGVSADMEPVVETAATLNGAVPGFESSGETNPFESAVDWALDNPWVILPILLGARLVVGARKK